MAKQFATLTSENLNPNLEGTRYYLQVDGHPRIRMELVEASELGQAAQEMPSVEWLPIPGVKDSESLRFPVTADIRPMIPARAFQDLRAGRPIEIPGPIGELCVRVGGVKALAAMMECTVEAIERWARETRMPSGPARVLMQRIGEEYGVTLKFKASPKAQTPPSV